MLVTLITLFLTNLPKKTSKFFFLIFDDFNINLLNYKETEREEEYWKIQKSLEFFHFSEHVVKQARKLQKMDFSNLFQLL